MPYKDKESQKKAVREAVQKHRKGITSEGITQQGITRIEFIKEELRIRDKEGKVLNEYFIDEIEAAVGKFKDREPRYERAYRYHQWKAGEEVAPAIAYALVYDRTKLEKIHQSLKDFNVSKEVRLGVNGLTFDVVGELLEKL